MANSDDNPNNSKSAKYIYWIIIVAILSILLSGKIQFWLPEYSHMDFVKYKTMAEASPGFSQEIIRPFVFRIAAPWLAGLLPITTEMSFYILNSFSLILLAIVFYKFLVQNNLELRISFVLTVCFVFNRYFFQFNGWNYFHLADVLSLILIMAVIVKSFKNEWSIVFPLFLLGVLIKESVLIVLPVILVKLIMTKASAKSYTYFAIVSTVSILLFLGIRILLPNAGGESLWHQFYTGVIYFLTPVSLAKKIFVAFIPFGLIPFLFYKESYHFLKKNPHYTLMIFLAFILSFFGDAERLMALAAPAYFVLIGEIIQTHLSEKSSKTRFKKVLAWLIIVAFLSSFYHLWGILRLPRSTYSIITTIITSLATGFISWTIRRNTDDTKRIKIPVRLFTQKRS